MEIDGAFADWSAIAVADTDPIPVENENIDIDEIGASNDASSSYFYVSVEGEICSGAYVPSLKGRPSGSGGGTPVTPVRKTGEDFLRIFIDTDRSSATGYPMSTPSGSIGADYMIEVVGQYGEIVDERLYRYTGTWDVVVITFQLAKDAQRIEIGLPSAAIGGASTVDFVVETTDWKDRMDSALYDLVASTFMTAMDTRGWVIDSTSVSEYATATSNQRKLFYDGTNFWSFYWDGSDTVYKYSSDGGVTWSSATAAFTTSGVNKTSLWYDETNYVVYIIGDTSESTTNVTLRRGVVSPSTHSISWGTESINATSTLDYGNKDTYICKDANGYLWIVSTSLTNQNPYDKFNLRTRRSANVDDVSAWLDRGNIVGSQNVPTLSRAVFAPGKQGSGIAIWAILSSEGEVSSLTHDDNVWSSPTTLYSGGDSEENTLSAPASAVIDANGVIHAIYGTGDVSGPNWEAHIHYTYNAGSGWTTPLALNATDPHTRSCPTISLDSTTGNVFAMWLQHQSGNNDYVVVKKNDSGTWGFVSLPANSYPKNHLTSIYSAPGEFLVCMQWTQNSTTNLEVIFEKIPEFSDVVLPVMFILTIFAVYRIRTGRDGRQYDDGA